MAIAAAYGGPAVTALACYSTKSFFAGHSDGVVRAFSLTDGALLHVFQVPGYPTAEEAAALVSAPSTTTAGTATGRPGCAVVALAVYGALGTPMLAVGHADGTIHSFAASSAAYAFPLKTAPGLTQLLALRRFDTLAAVHTGRNTLHLWDLANDRSLILDFTSELESIHRKSSQLVFARYDDARGVVLCGADDGSIFVRAVSRIPGTNDVAVKLARFQAPSSSATAPSKVRGGRSTCVFEGVLGWEGVEGGTLLDTRIVHLGFLIADPMPPLLARLPAFLPACLPANSPMPTLPADHHDVVRHAV